MDKQDKAIIEAFRVLFKDFSQQLITYLTAENNDQKELKFKIINRNGERVEKVCRKPIRN